MYHLQLKRKGTLQMEKKLIFSQSDLLYTVAGASVLTGILYFITLM